MYDTSTPKFEKYKENLVSLQILHVSKTQIYIILIVLSFKPNTYHDTVFNVKK